MAVLLPWPTRQQRQDAINQARRERDSARKRAAHAAQVQEQIRRMAAENHFASSIARQIIERHRGTA